MNEMEKLPFEVGVEKAKHDIVNAVNYIGQKYGIPSSILAMILSNLANENKLNAMETIIANYGIVPPETVTSPDSQPEETEPAE